MKKNKLLIYILKKSSIYIIICSIISLLYLQGIYAEEIELSEDDCNSILSIEYDHYEDENRIQAFSNAPLEKANNIVVFVRFQDTAEYVTNSGINYADITYNTGNNSLKNYLGRISYGEIDISSYFYPKDSSGNYYSVQVSKNADYYKKQRIVSGIATNGYTSSSERFAREDELITEVVTAIGSQLEKSGLDLDTNGDGFIDGISFVVPTYGLSYIDNVDHGDLLWPHKSDTYINKPINGKYVYTYNIVNKGSSNIGIMGSKKQSTRTVIHEFLHTLGLPDLYRYYNMNVYPVGGWDIMDGGSTEPANLTSWYQREYLGLGASIPIIDNTTKGVTLQPAKYKDSNEIYSVIVKSERNAGEYFVVENRQIENGNEGTQLNAGLLVYRIYHGKYGPGAGSGNAQGPDFLFAFRPNESGLNKADGNIGNAPLSPDNPYGFISLGKALGTETSGYDNKTIYYADGSNSGIIIDNIKMNFDQSITFDVTLPSQIKGSGSKENPYEIYTASDLNILAASKNGIYYKLMNDIDLSGSNFTPIKNFMGIFDGNGKTLKNLNITSSESASFIDCVDIGGIIKNLSFESPVIIAGRGYAGVIANVMGALDNIYVSGGTITSSERAGGLAGVLNDTGTIKNCYSSAKVQGLHAGGLLSYMSGGKLSDSYACGPVIASGNDAVTGGILSYWLEGMNGKIENTYWDIAATMQEENGRIFQNQNPCRVSGGYGLKLKVPDTISETSSEKAIMVVVNGMNTITGSWKSADLNVAEIDLQTGIISYKGGGTTRILYEFTVGSHLCTIQKELTVIGSLPPETVPPTTEPLITESSVTEAPTTVPPATEVPTTEPPATEAPTTESPATEPPTTEPPATEAPTTAPPATETPTTESPATEPPATETPATNPPVTEPPTTEPPQGGYDDPVEAFVARFYINILSRQPDVSGLKAWSNNLKTGKEQGVNVGYGFLESVEFKKRNLSDDAYIKVLYRAFFDREADTSGLLAWKQVLDSGLSRLHVYRGFAESREFTSICQKYNIQRGSVRLTEPRDQNEGITKFVIRCYRLCLGRNADEEGLNGWCKQILSGANSAKAAAYGFVFSTEFKNKYLSNEDYVKTLYRVFMDRESDPQGLKAWVSVLASGKDREHVFNGFADSAEFKDICSEYGISN